MPMVDNLLEEGWKQGPYGALSNTPDQSQICNMCTKFVPSEFLGREIESMFTLSR